METSGGQAMEDNPSGRKAKHVRYPYQSKPRHTKNGPGNKSSLDGAKKEYNPSQPTLKQTGPMTTGCWERDNHTPPDDDEASLGNDEFAVPENPVEQDRFKRKLMATANSLKKKQ